MDEMRMYWYILLKFNYDAVLKVVWVYFTAASALSVGKYINDASIRLPYFKTELKTLRKYCIVYLESD